VLPFARRWIPAFAGMSGKVVATLLLLFAAMATPAFAQDELRIGMGFGLAFLPLYVCEDLKLIEKDAKAAGLDVKVSFPRQMGAAAVADALASGAIDVGPFGTAPLLAAWDKAKDTPNQIFAVSGMTSLPLTLLSNQPDEQSVADLKPTDHIAVPTLTSPQIYVLALQSEKTFGQYDRLRGQTVALSHGDAMAAMVANGAAVTAYFASPPFTELALRDASIHPLLRSSDAMGGKFSFLILGATKATIDREPQIPAVLEQAMDDAARIIHDNPARAAQIYLTHEPSEILNGAAMAAVIRDIKDEFGSPVYGVQTMADFLSRHDQLKSAPRSWKDIVAPALLNSPST
jgi:NitT/TauT family transport system substrate-binding protein